MALKDMGFSPNYSAKARGNLKGLFQIDSFDFLLSLAGIDILHIRSN
jgi:hypothetical protein